MKRSSRIVIDIIKTVVGCAIFGLGFNLFLVPNDLNAGGISGLAMVFVHITNFATIGTITAVVNLPLFILAGLKVGKKFFWSSLLGMLFSSLAIDLFAMIPHPEVEPLIGALYGGLICGLGLGIVFSAGGSTGGSDIIVRLLKKRWPNVPIGIINSVLDMCVAVLTGIAFWNIERALYSGVSIIVAGRIIDAVVYSFDYSRVALIISSRYEEIADGISHRLEKGVTFLDGQGYYTRNNTKVILTAVKRQQLAELKELVVGIDPHAFIIVQEAHQVLGDGFSRYSKDSL
jgi:uncharacterized membrane-anchored protein YitT (DUF2179 family)